MLSMPFSVCSTTPEPGVEVVGDHGGLADAEVDEGRRAGCRGRPAAAISSFVRASSRLTSPPHDPVDVDAGVTTPPGRARRSRRPRAPGRRPWSRRGGHDRPEVAGGLAVDEVAHPVGPVRADQRDVAVDRVLQHVGAAVDLAGLLALGERRADRRSGRRTRRSRRRRRASARPGCPAAPARARSCPRGRARRRPTSPSAAGTSRSPCAPGPSASSAASPVSPLPALLLTTVRSVAPCRISASISATGIPARPKPPTSTVDAVRDVGDRLVRPVVAERRSRVTTTFSSTTASAWPTPMQIAATPHRSPDSRSRVRQGAEDPAAGGAERVADRDRAALGVDDLRVDLPGVDAGQRLHGERLVELDRARRRPR